MANSLNINEREREIIDDGKTTAIYKLRVVDGNSNAISGADVSWLGLDNLNLISKSDKTNNSGFATCSIQISSSDIYPVFLQVTVSKTGYTTVNGKVENYSILEDNYTTITLSVNNLYTITVSPNIYGSIKIGTSTLKSETLSVSSGTTIYVKCTANIGYVVKDWSVTNATSINKSIGGAINDGYFVVGTSDCNVSASFVQSTVTEWTYENGYRIIKGGTPGENILKYDTIKIEPGYTGKIEIISSTTNNTDGIFLVQNKISTSDLTGSLEESKSKFYNSTYSTGSNTKTIENIPAGTYYAGYRVK